MPNALPTDTPRHPPRVTRIRRPAALAAGVVAAFAAVALLAAAPATVAKQPQRPNIVLLLTDDQEWASMPVMKTVRRELRRKGVTMKRMYAQFPLCCPARATILTGQYVHNHDVRSNKPPEGGFGRFNALHGGNSLNDWLQAAGYRTGYIGKFLNKYAEPDPFGTVPTTVPEGWDDWHVLAPTKAQYFDYRLNENGRLRAYGEQEADYSTDKFTKMANRFIRRSARRRAPFFLMLGYAAPHNGGAGVPDQECRHTALPAPRHQGTLTKLQRQRPRWFRFPPSFDEPAIADKPSPIAERPRFTPRQLRAIKRKRQCAWESLLAVDESVGEIVAQLKRTKELRNTYVFFTSDNGYLRGEHRVTEGKRMLYEESARVPLVVRGPGIPHGASSRDVVVNADLTATILDLTGAQPGLPQDGVSLMPSLTDPAGERGRAILLEAYAGIPVTGIRTERYLYTEWEVGDGPPEVELYDMHADPYQLRNVADDPAYAEARALLAAERDALIDCVGAACATAPSGSLTLVAPKAKRGCVREPVLVRFTSSQEEAVTGVAFEVPGARARRDPAPPFEARIGLRALRRAKRGEIIARATFADGRRLASSESVRTCAGRRR